MSPGAALWAGRILSILPVGLLTMSAVMKFVQPAGFADGMAHMGVPMPLAPALGVLELACTAIYLIPRTAVLGAILLTGYLGGAIMTHVRVGDPFILQFLLGAMLWGGLYFRDARVRALIPLRSV
ncbi:MAG: DoxX family protein [Bryobacterales bacterium]|nr:DoxX family protein [Bryobacterales bacterium]